MVTGSYTVTVWKEHEVLTEAAKIALLNHAETQAEESGQYISDMPHVFYTIAEADARYARTPSHPSGRSDIGHGCGLDAAKVGGYTLAQLLAAAFPVGSIAMFGSGTLPDSWEVCDGSGGNPDMQGRLPRGAGSGVTPGSYGGSNSATPTASNFTSADCTLTDNQIPRHTHAYTDPTNTTYNNAWTPIANSYPYSSGAYSRATKNMGPGEYVARTAHNHAGCTFSWTGYKDESDNTIAGALDVRPACRTVRFIRRQ